MELNDYTQNRSPGQSTVNQISFVCILYISEQLECNVQFQSQFSPFSTMQFVFYDCNMSTATTEEIIAENKWR